jgi:hypothetical protein
MAASLATTVIDISPGNLVTLAGVGLVGGSNASVTISNQGVTNPPNLVAQTITLPAAFASDGLSVFIGPIPDGVTNGTITVTSQDGTTAAVAAHAVSQYVQASQYIGEGVPTDSLAAMTAAGVSELDVILRRASSIADRYMGGDGVRLLQILEQPKYRPPLQEMAPRLYLWRTRGRRVPIVSVDQLVFVSATNLLTTFKNTDIYINSNLNYIEVLAYAIGDFALLGDLETIGYSANVFNVTYTSGFGYADYPQAVIDATIVIATALLNRRLVNAMALGGMKKYEDAAPADLVIPELARVLLRPYMTRAFA